MQSDNEDNEDLDDASHASPIYALYINKTPKFAVYDVILYIPDQLNLSLLNPLYLAPLSQKNNIS
jgi:hypothetical protein